MMYSVIGLMSGSSHDGLDICYAQLKRDSKNQWDYKILDAVTVPFPTVLKEQLKIAAQLSVPDFLNLDVAFGQFCGQQVNDFMAKNKITETDLIIGSHGHTVWHEPAKNISCQIGSGATIAAITRKTTFSNFRNLDVALGGQGAPIVPITDRLLFSNYDFCLNLGGIANITINQSNPVAFDICPANQLLDFFAAKKGLEFDKNGELASKGKVNFEILETIAGNEFYQKKAPKSLANSFSKEEIIPNLESLSVEDALATSVKHIAQQIAHALKSFFKTKPTKMLITGGGAFNHFLIGQIRKELASISDEITCVVPEAVLVNYKEALAMGVMATLRAQHKNNVLASVTGATSDSSGGDCWLGS